MKLPNIINMIMDFGKCSYSLQPFLFRSIIYFISTRLSNTLYSTMSPIRKRKNSKVDDTNREITIDLVIDEGKTMASLVRLKILEFTVKSIVSTFCETNCIAKLPKGGNRSTKQQDRAIAS